MESTFDIEDLKYPVGPLIRKDFYSAEEIASFTESIAAAPRLYKDTIEKLPASDMFKTYRPGSWNVQQLVHHVADIQLLHFLRMKKALTEPDYKDVTLIDMDKWVSTADGIDAPTEDSLIMLEGITRRYIFLIRSLNEDELSIEYFHPVRKYTVNQAQAIAMSAWHLKHHLAHIELAVK